MRDLKGRVAFITGAASGIGLALVKACAAEGMKVMLADIDRDGLETAVSELTAFGAEADSVTCNVADPESIQAAARATTERFGSVHLLANNAGILEMGMAENTPLKSWRRAIDINLMGVIHGVETFLPLMKSHGEGGHILITASVGGHVGFAGWTPYCTTKHALIGYGECLASELSGGDIGVSLLCPGLVSTRLAEIDRFEDDIPARSREEEEVFAGISNAISAGMSPDVVAGFALKQIQADALYIFTHPGTRDEVEERYPRVSAAFTVTENDPLINSDPDSKRVATKEDVEGMGN